MTLEELFEQIKTYFHNIVKKQRSTNFEFSGWEWNKYNGKDGRIDIFGITERDNVQAVENYLTHAPHGAMCPMRIFGSQIHIELHLRQEQRSYILIKKNIFNCIKAEGGHELQCHNLFFDSALMPAPWATRAATNTRLDSEVGMIIIYEGEFDVKSYQHRKSGAIFTCPATLWQVYEACNVMTKADQCVTSYGGGNPVQPIVDLICEYYKDYYLTHERPEIATRLLDLRKNCAVNTCCIDAGSRLSYFKTDSFYHLPIWQYVFSKDTDTLCRTLGAEPIPDAHRYSESELISICKTAKLLTPDAQIDYYKYLSTHDEDVQNRIGPSADPDDIIMAWLIEKTATQSDLQTNLCRVAPRNYLNLKKSMREKIPLLNNTQDWLDDCRDVIYRKASKQKKLTSTTLEMLDVLPQVKQLDAEFAKGIDGAYRIKRVKTYEDFVAMCCEFYVDPVSCQNSLCYIVETDDGYLYLMVVERDNSVANFGVGFSTVMIRATQGGAFANYACDIGRAMNKIIDDVNSKFGVKRKTNPRVRFIL